MDVTAIASQIYTIVKAILPFVKTATQHASWDTANVQAHALASTLTNEVTGGRTPAQSLAMSQK